MEALLDQHPLLHAPRAKPLPTRKDRPHASASEDADDDEDERAGG
jgi:hypothetical protein